MGTWGIVGLLFGQFCIGMLLLKGVVQAMSDIIREEIKGRLDKIEADLWSLKFDSCCNYPKQDRESRDL